VTKEEFGLENTLRVVHVDRIPTDVPDAGRLEMVCASLPGGGWFVRKELDGVHFRLVSRAC
jgi:hypothetical protein